ncbi:required for excision 1-B domain-containing protein-like [Ptychodera flava]|uniref:required for excision 1-B domain-containing protein-like n=1 Tax=Ptychodera flava TaxID=63121 RepID=UPI00396A0C8E
MADDESAKSLLKTFYNLQGERVHTYRIFDGHHQEYLKDAPNYDFPKYRQAVHEATEEFKRISQGILAVEDKLRNKHNRRDLAGFIRRVQDEEKTKLELTAHLQLAKQNVIDHPSDDSHKEEVNQLKQRLIQVIDNINECLEDLRYETEDLES